MTESEPRQYQSVPIPQAAYERHRDRKAELGVTWAEYLDGQAPGYDHLVDALADGIREAAREGAREGVEAALEERTWA